jgi:hypothetical protein
MSKKWYTVTFSAKMSEDDVRAMKKCFYDAMEEAMEISPCADLNIKPEDEEDIIMTDKRKQELFDNAITWIWEHTQEYGKEEYIGALEYIGFTEEEIDEELAACDFD